VQTAVVSKSIMRRISSADGATGHIGPVGKRSTMIRRRPITLFASAVLVPLTLFAAACGSGDDNSSSASSGATTSSAATKSATSSTVAVASTNLGNVLVNSEGRTLYLFGADSGTKSACSGACAAQWPPLVTSGTPTAGSGAKASLVGTSMRSDGKQQVTYNGHPVYTYAGDQQAGDTNGQGLNAFGGSWFALTASGDQVSGSASGSTGGNGLGY
jgi:predicted lipoprotein with Yx(FWY)xxD motif